MAVLNPQLTQQLASHLAGLTRPVELVATLDDRRDHSGSKSAELLDLLTQIAGLSEMVSVRTDGHSHRRPSFSIERPAADGEGLIDGIEFAGVPLGHEFTSLVLAILHVGGVAPKVSDETAAAIRSIDRDLVFETYMSLTCQNCPDVVQALNVISVLNRRISHVAIDGSLFRDEVEQRKVMAVPTVFANGEPFGQGRMSLDEIVAKLDTGAAARAAAELARRDPYDVLVVGGGPAGAAAAIYAARKGIRTGLVAERFGGQVLDTMAIENLISVPHTEGPKLVRALEQHVHEYDVDVIDLQRATRLVPAGDPDDGLTSIELASGATLRARSVVLATGARWRSMNVPGEQEYRNKGVTFCPHCDGPLFAGKRVAVIGGGNSGVEAAIDLAGVVAQVTLFEFLDELRADEVLQRKLRSLQNVDVILSAQTTEVIGDGVKVTGLAYADRGDGSTHVLDLDGVFVQIGLLPNTEWLAGSVELSTRGEIVVDERGQTSVPGVFAAGDATTAPFKQIVIALGSGATAALGAFDHLIRSTAPVPALVA
jgi:alkyl hydroperoxide reductase subunit F